MAEHTSLWYGQTTLYLGPKGILLSFEVDICLILKNRQNEDPSVLGRLSLWSRDGAGPHGGHPCWGREHVALVGGGGVWPLLTGRKNFWERGHSPVVQVGHKFQKSSGGAGGQLPGTTRKVVISKFLKQYCDNCGWKTCFSRLKSGFVFTWFLGQGR